ncbi:MAG TPA: MdtA/MuxA family multidrug efflux RND transporter periplasmic adaptor subunit [Terriglobales bacterium]|nr:MdtA/MuxA family multidrug efflux RND transporter periplasmic adaptor subunit [Terriglobales bacterium]
MQRNFLKRKYTLVLVIVVAMTSVLLGCGSAARPATARAAYNQAVPVATAPVVQRDMPVYLVGLGSVTPLYAVSVKTRVDGQLVQVNFREGQQVKKGTLLAVIDPRPFEVALSQAEAQLFKDQAQLRDAKLNYERFRDLLQQSGAISQQQVDTQKATVDQFEGAVRADQANIDSAKLQLTYCHITAPIDGRVGLRLLDPGNMVHASDANPLLVITQLQPITVIFTLPEDQLPEVARHMRTGSLTVEAYSRDDQTKLSTGRLLTIDNEIDPNTGTGRLKAEFRNPDNALWPNQFVNVRLLLETRKNSLVVPAAAVQRGPQGTYVFVVKSDNSVDLRPVTVAISQGNLSAISNGLAADEIVVTDGQDKLQAGSKVEPRQGRGPATAPPGTHPAPQSAGNPAL